MGQALQALAGMKEAHYVFFGHTVALAHVQAGGQEHSTASVFVKAALGVTVWACCCGTVLLPLAAAAHNCVALPGRCGAAVEWL